MPLIVIEPQTTTPSEIDAYNSHWQMCMIRCNVRMRTARSGGSGVLGRPGHHGSDCQLESAGNRLRGETDIAQRSTGGAEDSSAVYRTRGHGTDGVRSQGTDSRITEADDRPANTTVSTSAVRPLDVQTTARDIEVGPEAARSVPRMAGTDEDLRQVLDNITRDARQLGEELRAFRPKLANELPIPAWVSPTPPQQSENRRQKLPGSAEFSGSDRAQSRGRIAQLRMVMRHKPASCPNEQSKIRLALDCLREISLDQISPHVREDREIGLEDLPAFIQLMEAAFGDPDRVATAEWTMLEIEQKNRKFSQSCTEIQVLAGIWIGVLRPYGMLCDWDCLKK